jgi:DNA-directed RNA polymerase alpha subunit
MLAENIPYGLLSRFNQHDYISFVLLEIAYKCGNKELANKIKTSLAKDLQQQLAYFANVGNMTVNELMQATQELLMNKGDNLTNAQKNMFTEIRQAIAMNEGLRNLETIYK